MNIEIPKSSGGNATNITVGATTITGGATGNVVIDNSGVVGELAYGTTSAATSLVERDASQNAFANNFISKGANVSAGGTTTLTAASARIENFTGSSQTAKLPDATTLAVGATFTFNNNGSTALAVVDNSSGAVVTIPVGGYAQVYAISVSTSAGSWDSHSLIPTNSSWGTAALTTLQVITTANAIAASSNAATIPVTSKNNIVTNDSAGDMTITLTTTGAVNMQSVIVQILDFSGVAKSITWVNTENSGVSAPTTSNGSTTLPLTAGFIYNSATSKWRCIASA